MLPSARWPPVTKQLGTTLWHAGISLDHRTVSQSPPEQMGLKSPSVALLGSEQQPPGSAFHFFFMGCLFLWCLGMEPKHSPHLTLPLLHTLPAVKPYPAEYHVFDINYMSKPHESHWNLMRCRDGTTEPMAFIKRCHGDQFARLDPH